MAEACVHAIMAWNAFRLTNRIVCHQLSLWANHMVFFGWFPQLTNGTFALIIKWKLENQQIRARAEFFHSVWIVIMNGNNRIQMRCVCALFLNILPANEQFSCVWDQSTYSDKTSKTWSVRVWMKRAELITNSNTIFLIVICWNRMDKIAPVSRPIWKTSVISRKKRYFIQFFSTEQ